MLVKDDARANIILQNMRTLKSSLLQFSVKVKRLENVRHLEHRFYEHFLRESVTTPLEICDRRKLVLDMMHLCEEIISLCEIITQERSWAEGFFEMEKSKESELRKTAHELLQVEECCFSSLNSRNEYFKITGHRGLVRALKSLSEKSVA